MKKNEEGYIFIYNKKSIIYLKINKYILNITHGYLLFISFTHSIHYKNRNFP